MTLAYVHDVTMCGEPTPLALIQCWWPDVRVPGGEDMPETVVGRAEVEAYGGTVHIVPSVFDVSTIAIVDRLVPGSRPAIKEEQTRNPAWSLGQKISRRRQQGQRFLRQQ